MIDNRKVYMFLFVQSSLIERVSVHPDNVVLHEQYWAGSAVTDGAGNGRRFSDSVLNKSFTVAASCLELWTLFEFSSAKTMEIRNKRTKEAFFVGVKCFLASAFCSYQIKNPWIAKNLKKCRRCTGGCFIYYKLVEIPPTWPWIHLKTYVQTRCTSG